jgi:hypothetical protein
MRRPISFILLILLISLLNNIHVKGEIIQDLLIGTEKDSLYSYRLGSLMVEDGDSLYVEILAQNSLSFYLTLLSPINEEILTVKLKSNEIQKIFTFDNQKYGYYKIIVKDEIGIVYIQAFINYVKKQKIINDFEYSLNVSNNMFFINTNFTLPKTFRNASFYLGLLTNESILNFTNQLIVEASGGIEGTKITRIGFSVIKQDIKNNSLIIMPLIYNSTKGYINLKVDKLDIYLYSQNVFDKTINGTRVITYTPSLIAKYSFENFIIGKDKIIIPITNILGDKLIYLNINYTRNENPLSYNYNTFFIYQKTSGIFYQVLKEVKLENNETINGIAIKGSLNFEFSNLFEYNSTSSLKNIYVALIIKENSRYYFIVKKFDYKITEIMLYNTAKNNFVKNFNLIVKDALSYTINDKAILIYKDMPSNIIININNAKIPLRLLYNKTIDDYGINIISYKFYNLTLKIIAEGLDKPNATVKIYYNDLLLFDSIIEYGLTNLLLPSGNYKIEVLKEGFVNFTQTFILDGDKTLVISLYKIRTELSGSDYAYISALTFILFLQIILNLYIYRKVRKI